MLEHAIHIRHTAHVPRANVLVEVAIVIEHASHVRDSAHVPKADILVEQLIFTGHGLSGLEGMASGLVTISNLEDETYTLPMRRWSFLDECPLVSATPENIKEILRVLVKKPELRKELGNASRKYVEKYHGLDSAHYLFSNVIDYVYGKKNSIINLYHPILGTYNNRSPKIDHPLIKNQIISK